VTWVSDRRWLAGIALAIVASALIAVWSPSGTDYLSPGCEFEVCDDAGQSIDALSHGDFDTFFAQQPPMGSFSLLLRTPPAMLANAVGGDDLLLYRLGVFACMLVAALLAVFLALTMMRRGRPWTVWALVAAAFLLNPLTYQAAYYGHPEEILAAALTVAAVLAAGRRHWLLGGLAMGAAIATKQWAALAVLPALIAAPAGTRVRFAVTLVALAGALTLPMIAGDPGRFKDAQELVSVGDAYENTVTGTNLWWLFSSPSAGVGTDVNGETQTLTQYSLPHDVGRMLHLAVIGFAIGLSALYLRRRGRGDPEDLLLLVSLIFLLRCMLDPLTFSYHHAPYLMALIAYEGLRRELPVLSAWSIVAVLAMDEVVAPAKDVALINAAYMLWTIPLAAAMGLALFAPDRYEALGGRLRERIAAVALPRAAPRGSGG